MSFWYAAPAHSFTFRAGQFVLMLRRVEMFVQQVTTQFDVLTYSSPLLKIPATCQT